MPKGHLFRVPWPGNSWMPFTFQSAHRALQQSHKRSHSLQLATHTELARPHQSIKKALESDTPSLFIPVAAMEKRKQINNSILQYVSDVISSLIHERKLITQFRYYHTSYCKLDIMLVPFQNCAHHCLNISLTSCLSHSTLRRTVPSFASLT